MSKNKFFRDASEPCNDMAAIFLHLDDAGHLDADMREALRQHSENALSTIPQNIGALCKALAAASDSGWIGKQEVTNAAYGLAEMADMLGCFQRMYEEFDFKKNRGRQ